MCKWTYDLFYYTATSVKIILNNQKFKVISWYFFSDSDWYPSALGGKGGATNLI